MFVANRVQEIQDRSSIDQLEYIESKENPADEASREMKAQEPLDSRWITGPAFLWKKENQWQTSNIEVYELQDDPEVKKSVAMATATNMQTTQAPPEKSSLVERVKCFSDWHRAKRAVALCLCYVRCLRDRVHMRKRQNCSEETRGSGQRFGKHRACNDSHSTE